MKSSKSDITIDEIDDEYFIEYSDAINDILYDRKELINTFLSDCYDGMNIFLRIEYDKKKLDRYLLKKYGI